LDAAAFATLRRDSKPSQSTPRKGNNRNKLDTKCQRKESERETVTWLPKKELRRRKGNTRHPSSNREAVDPATDDGQTDSSKTMPPTVGIAFR
jgi:hypothetical protein